LGSTLAGGGVTMAGAGSADGDAFALSGAETLAMIFARIASSFRTGAGVGAGGEAAGAGATTSTEGNADAGADPAEMPGRGESAPEGVTAAGTPPGSCRTPVAKRAGCDAELSEKPGPISAAGFLPWEGATVSGGGAAATNAGVEAGGPEAGALLDVVPVTLAGFMIWGVEVALDDGVAVANAGVETGGLETSARLGAVPVTLAGFMTWSDDAVPDGGAAVASDGRSARPKRSPARTRVPSRRGRRLRRPASPGVAARWP